ncbi:MAG: DUF6350 family protein, partial [Microbacterium sp.]
MHRLLVAFLAAVDAVIAIAVGLAVILAPLTLVWVIGFGGAADWGTLWPVAATIWQFGHVVPLSIELPGDYLAATGIDPTAGTFALSLAPLAFAAFTTIFAARSGRRASRADAWITGVVTGTVIFAGLTSLVAVTGATAVARVELWQAILVPSLLFFVPALLGAVATEWAEATHGGIARLRDRLEATQGGWGEVVSVSARGAAVAVVGLIGVGALGTAFALIARGGEVVALFEAAHVDAFGATVVALGQLAYLPTLLVWAISFVAGPGFSLGVGTSVAPGGTQVGVVPGIPVLGAIPEATSPWLLLLALLPIALGAFAGWIARSRLVGAAHRAIDLEADAAHGGARTAALGGLLDSSASPPERAGWIDDDDGATPDPFGPRLVATAGIAVLAAAAVALFARLASGALGPGTLALVGPEPGPVALAVGAEVALGAGILLLSPRRHERRTVGESDEDATDAPRETA